jgi:hypothetical protein
MDHFVDLGHAAMPLILQGVKSGQKSAKLIEQIAIRHEAPTFRQPHGAPESPIRSLATLGDVRGGMVGSASWRRVRLEDWDEDSASPNLADSLIIARVWQDYHLINVREVQAQADGRSPPEADRPFSRRGVAVSLMRSVIDVC